MIDEKRNIERRLGRWKGFNSENGLTPIGAPTAEIFWGHTADFEINRSIERNLGNTFAKLSVQEANAAGRASDRKRCHL
jgi:hypothetical protein